MISLFKNIFLGKIDDVDISSVLSKLDWDIDSPEERLKLVQELLDGEDVFTRYFAEVYDCNISGEDCLSEDLYAVKALNVISDYLLMGATKDKAVNPILFDSSDNYYKSNDIAVTKSDLHHDVYGAILSDYQDFKTAVRLSELTKQKQDKIVGEITKDMTATKEALQRPITPNASMGTYEPIHWLDMDYGDVEQIKLLLRIKPRSLFTDLGILTYDLDMALKEIDLAPSERRVIDRVRNGDNKTLDETAKDISCSRQYIDRVLGSIAKKLVKAKKIF